MAEHELKTWPHLFDAIKDGRKRFDIRRNDRGFQTGDILTLRKYDPTPVGDGLARMHGWSPPAVGYLDEPPLRMRITYVLSGFGLKENYVALGIEPLEGPES